ncbi:MAG: pyruvate, phosphate dikinase [Chloroflexi bacterium]|nr:pyruvate, phosphate dikinase [Chloroflexota bacterium]
MIKTPTRGSTPTTRRAHSNGRGKPAARVAKRKPATQWVYRFDEVGAAEAYTGLSKTLGRGWEGVRALLGGKGSGLADMARRGLPVPPGFTVTTEACNAYLAAGEKFPAGLWAQELAALKEIEKQTGKKFGDAKNPLFVSCRSGAKFSMPGMMDTVLNIGLNDDTAAGLIALSGNPRFVYDSYRRLVQMYGSVVMGLAKDDFEKVLEAYRHKRGVTNDADLETEDLQAVTAEFKKIVREKAGCDFPADPVEQLRLATEAVFRSWNGKRAIDYRNASKIPHDLGTAVNIVTMVFGNMGQDSGTGVLTTRNVSDGANEIEGDFLINAQGEDVVAGARMPKPMSDMKLEMPRLYAQLEKFCRKLEKSYTETQDIEFTIERGKLWLLQTRNAKRTAQAAIRIAVEQAEEKLITRAEAVRRVQPGHIDFFLHPQFDPKDMKTAKDRGDQIANGLNVSPGAAVGQLTFDADTAERWAREDKKDVIMVRPETKPDDVHGMLAAKGILTSRGGRTSHAALVARQFGKPAVVGCSMLDVDTDRCEFRVGGRVFKEGDWVSIDGTTGVVFAGRIKTIIPDFNDPYVLKLLSWADAIRTLGVWANADYPRDAERARAYGAEGIGLCRTEHMFFETVRLPFVQQMILAKTDAERAEPLARLLPFQRSDFDGLFRAMDGLPVTIRLIDPPLHEFLPSHDELLKDVTGIEMHIADQKDRILSVKDRVESRTKMLDVVEAMRRHKGDNSGLPSRAELAQGITDLTQRLAAYEAEVAALSAEVELKRKMLSAVESMREANPMLGLRGVRLGIHLPALTIMQVRAIFEAACQCAKEGVDVHPKIMIPLTAHVNELKTQQTVLEEEARKVMAEQGCEVDYQFGTMIEIPRAALTADQIAQYAQFFSYGTNDLTQTTFGISRDDAETGFLMEYLERGILLENPFASVDEEGVGKLMNMGVELGRQTRPDLEVGICGEHGGDPKSIAFCHKIGLNYVSCSPFRVPIARLAAAHAALGDGIKDL